jgi:hypothetical protein
MQTFRNINPLLKLLKINIKMVSFDGGNITVDGSGDIFTVKIGTKEHLDSFIEMYKTSGNVKELELVFPRRREMAEILKSWASSNPSRRVAAASVSPYQNGRTQSDVKLDPRTRSDVRKMIPRVAPHSKNTEILSSASESESESDSESDDTRVERMILKRKSNSNYRSEYSPRKSESREDVETMAKDLKKIKKELAEVRKNMK